MSRLTTLLAFASCLGAICGAAGNTALAAPEPRPHAGPVCLYESKTYSEGAFVCVQKSLMLTCAANGDRLSWKPVSDTDINDRCTAPVAQHGPERTHPRGYRRHAAVRRAIPKVENLKCFVFNGREYCE
jgi:hypothetical protein